MSKVVFLVINDLFCFLGSIGLWVGLVEEVGFMDNSVTHGGVVISIEYVCV